MLDASPTSNKRKHNDFHEPFLISVFSLNGVNFAPKSAIFCNPNVSVSL